MAYISDEFEYDIFISYAHLDNKTSVREKYGLIDEFYSELEKQIPSKFGRAEVNIFFDGKLVSGNQRRSPEHIADFEREATRTAIFVIVASPAYFDDRFVAFRELSAFMSTRPAPSPSRVIVAEFSPVATYPADIEGHLRVPFSAPSDDGSYYRPPILDSEEEKLNFKKRVADLVHKIHQKVEKMRLSLDEGSLQFIPANDDVKTVLFAHVTGDVHQARLKVESHLGYYQLTLLPTENYPLTGEAFKRAFLQDLAKADIFVQLLGADKGAVLPDMIEPLTLFQYHAALAAGKTIVQWYPPQVKLSDIKDDDYREMLSGETVLATSLDELTTYIKRLAATPPKLVSMTRPVAVFLSVAESDSAIAASLKAALAGLNVTAGMPDFAKEAMAQTQTQRVEKLDSLSQCSTWVLICRNAPAEWIRAQLTGLSKLRASRDRLPKIVVLGEITQETKDQIDRLFNGARQIPMTDWTADAIEAVAKEIAR